MLRSILLLLITLLPALHASAQSVPVEDVSINLLNWSKHLHADADKYYTREKHEELTRNLEALEREVTIYMKTRKRLSDSIFRHNIAPGKKDPENLDLLKTQMGEIIRQMRNVTDLTNDALRAEGDRVNDQIFNVLNGEGNVYLSYLEAFMNGLDVSKKQMTLDGGTAYDRLQQTIGQLAATRDKIKRKGK
ncbi:hypothetical protein [Chitinophaga rhizophila]|uniref:DUF4142 domain-containing protein n=1 Tax=Chitinophaga rhizophila TaxID=2866212 RepID=A0ABS7G6E4_9BACT|nr:hypothetical protein [Chitinophaga rhizophila]MBW8682875.1 hypothetical protein [Chitinophaga rhizophila]